MDSTVRKTSSHFSKDARNQFVLKLYDILEDGSNAEYISWDADGKAVLLKDQAQLLEKVLPKYFSLTNYHSFIRQFSYYGFKKMNASDGIMKYISYSHPNFTRGRRDLLEHIIRKRKHSKQLAKEQAKPMPMPVPEEPLYQTQKKKEVEWRLLQELESCRKTITKLNRENYFLKTIMERKNTMPERITNAYPDALYPQKLEITARLNSLQSTLYEEPTQDNSRFSSTSFFRTESPKPAASRQQQANFFYYPRESQNASDQGLFNHSQTVLRRDRELNKPAPFQSLRETSRRDFTAAKTQNITDFLDQEDEPNPNLNDDFWF